MADLDVKEAEAPRRRSWLGTILALVIVGALLGLLAWGLGAKSPRTGIDASLTKGLAPAAPGFDLALLDPGTAPVPLGPLVARAVVDRRVDAAELRGHPYVLNIWASWCLPCRVEARTLETGWARAAPRGVLFVGLDQQDLISDARAFMARYGQTYLNIRDPDNDVARRWGATGIPETYFVSARGRVVSHVIGAVSAAQLAAGVNAAVSGRVHRPQEGGAREAAR